MTELEKLANASGINDAREYGESIPDEVLEKFAGMVVDWVAKMHHDQCREERPVQDWIRSTKTLLNWTLTS